MMRTTWFRFYRIVWPCLRPERAANAGDHNQPPCNRDGLVLVCFHISLCQLSMTAPSTVYPPGSVSRAMSLRLRSFPQLLLFVSLVLPPALPARDITDLSP